MVNKKTFTVIKANNATSQYRLNGELEYNDGKSEYVKVTGNFQAFDNDEVEVDLDQIKKISKYSATKFEEGIVVKKVSGGNNSTKIKIDDKDYTIAEYNEAFYLGKHPLLVEVKDLYAEI